MQIACDFALEIDAIFLNIFVTKQRSLQVMALLQSNGTFLSIVKIDCVMKFVVVLLV
jgi:hypothetical protein